MALLRLTVKNIVDKKFRFLLTTLAVFLGVMFTVGVFVFTDSLRSTFGSLSEDIESGYDLAVRSEIPFGERLQAAPVPLGLDDAIASTEGVAAIQPRVIEFNIIPIRADGEAAEAQGPNIGVNWEDLAPNPRLFLVDDGVGRAPTAPGEFAMDVDAAADDDFVVGESYRVQTADAGLVELELVGTFSFADPEENALVGAKLVAFDTATGVELLNAGEGYDDITVFLEEGADIDVVSAAIAAQLPDELEVVPLEVLVEEQADTFNTIVDQFQTFLLVFASVILLVSAFIIYNTFTIVIGQRIRELGLLRALGATGKQVTATVIGEAVLVGVVATATGIAAGIGLAAFLQWLLATLDFGPDETALPLEARTFWLSAVVGIGITVASAIWPAVKARRVSPMAALRDDVRLGSHNPKRNLGFGSALIAVGVAATVAQFIIDQWQFVLLLSPLAAAFIYLGATRIDLLLARFSVVLLGAALLVTALVADLGTSMVLTLLGAAALIIFLGVNLFSPLLARPAAQIIGRRPTAVVIGLVGGLLGVAALFMLGLTIRGLADGTLAAVLLLLPTAAIGFGAYLAIDVVPAGFRVNGLMARQNAARTPRRTASTAAALMIGLALVSTAAVVAASLKATFRETLSESVAADWFVWTGSGGDPNAAFTNEVAARLGRLDEVSEVASYRFADEAFRTIDDDVHDSLAADLVTLERHLDPGFIDIDRSLLGRDSLLVHEDFAADRLLRVGSTLEVDFIDQSTETLVIAGIYTDALILGNRVIDLELWDEKFSATQDQFVSALSAEEVNEDEARAAIESVVVDYPQITAQTKAEFQDDQEQQVDNFLIVINVLLALAIVIALLGVANTLALSVFERTRELGLVRAVGMTTRQMRRMVRWEAVIVALFGAIIGVGLGILFGVAASQAIPETVIKSVSIPVGQIIQFFVIAALAGVAAAVFPAYRASRMQVLDAIAEE